MRIASLPRRLAGELKTLRNLVRHRAYIDPKSERSIVEAFHRLYYDAHLFGKTWRDTSWMGIPCAKCPLDLWVYQEIIFETRPDLIVETGTFNGGSALYLASVCDMVGAGRVLTIDVEARRGRPSHRRIQYLQGSSTSRDVIAEVREEARGAGRVMVLLDSDHSKDHVLEELRLYGPLVTPGNYLIVEDSNVNGHPVSPDFGPGPMEAIEQFLERNADFVVDESRQKFYLTFNPRGYLRKVKAERGS